MATSQQQKAQADFLLTMYSQTPIVAFLDQKDISFECIMFVLLVLLEMISRCENQLVGNKLLKYAIRAVFELRRK